MAAPHQGSGEPAVVDLRGIASWELDPLLLAETEEWRRELDWDYAKSADLVRKFTGTGSLAGAALVDGGAVVGYGYTVVEDHKGLIGGLYVRPELRGSRAEGALFLGLFQELVNSAQVRRIESQLLLVDRATSLAAAKDTGLRLYERTLMTADVATLSRNVQTGVPDSFRMERWGDHWNEEGAAIILLAYRNHVDAEVNDQYRGLAAASRFLKNLVEFPGCGTFFEPASVIAFDRVSGRPAGIALCSFVAPEVGHVTQLCVTPEARGRGLGYALLRETLRGLAAAGAKRVGLTVTLTNDGAVRLYRRCGFRELRRFFAYAGEV